MSATDELRRLLDERGVEYNVRDGKAIKNTYWDDAEGRRWGYTSDESGAIKDRQLFLVRGRMDISPEQVIAATLGRETLTAEQVSEATYAHSIHADCADADWQAIADELNATLGSDTDATTARQGDTGTCYPVPIYSFDGEFTEYDCDACSECGTEWDGDTPNFCPNCGRRCVG